MSKFLFCKIVSFIFNKVKTFKTIIIFQIIVFRLLCQDFNIRFVFIKHLKAWHCSHVRRKPPSLIITSFISFFYLFLISEFLFVSISVIFVWQPEGNSKWGSIRHSQSEWETDSQQIKLPFIFTFVNLKRKVTSLEKSDALK